MASWAQVFDGLNAQEIRSLLTVKFRRFLRITRKQKLDVVRYQRNRDGQRQRRFEVYPLGNFP
jgi:hypothetical protein